MQDSCLDRFAPIAAIATHPQAAKILTPLTQSDRVQLWLPDSLASQSGSLHYQNSLKEHLASIWSSNNAFVFCLAAGAVVRLIAPLLKNKASDPAVIVVDANGEYVVSLLSGHQGQADLLTSLIAERLGAKTIVTGASSALSLPAIDTLGFTYGWSKGEGDWTGVMAAVAKQETVQIIQESGSTLWQKHLPADSPFYFGFAESRSPIQPQARIWVSPTQRKFAPKSDFPKVQWHPRVLWVGIGCERGTSAELISRAIDETCKTYHFANSAIAGIASINLKADEVGILEVCQQRKLPFKTFTKEELKQVEVPTPSEVVEAEVGTPSVAEAAATLAGNNLLVTKQIFKNSSGAVTVAIAQAETEYIGRKGKLYLVGIGPGSLNQITPAAKTAIIEADVVIGYSLYIDLVKSLQRPTQIIENSPITQEQQRAQRAIQLAQWGLTVAVISSGDCGIYGMAGLVLEELQAGGWDGQTPQVQVFPGISALQSAASRVGAPLMHDFCAISLSDLLTPWEVIEKRLNAAASGDFITTLYNPKSQKRTEQIAIAQRIFAQHRASNTPVAIVSKAYRQDERVTITTLSEMLAQSIDMLTTVIIGNNSSRNHMDWMITPRGYLDSR